MTEKRYDIQGLRAWAVIAVVLFHFFPSLLPFGYLGVDVFFVLSGYLISLVLDNKPVRAISTYTMFYYKRIRRIFPLLLLIIFLCSVYTAFCYNEMIFQYSEKSALRAALFITNLKGNNEGEDYFRDLEHADDVYTHTWSLSVEIQFYMLAPLLLHVLMPVCSDSFHSIGYLLIFAGFSFQYSRGVTASTAFYSTIARLWQFTAGAIAFQLQKVKELPTTEKSHVESKYSTALSVNTAVPSVFAVILILWSAVFEGWESTMRCAVTFSAALLLVINVDTPFLTHRSLQIIGDSSYALYLIHWPVVCALRFYDGDHWMVRLIAMLLCFTAAIIIYNFYEKWYLTLNGKWTAVLIGILYLASLFFYWGYCLVVSDTTEYQLGDTETPRTYGEASMLNRQMDLQWERYIRVKDCTLRDPSVDQNPWGYCNLPPGNGSLSFFIIGNSYAANHGRMIVENLREHYGNIAIHTVGECEPLIDTVVNFCNATKIREGFLSEIEKFKPNVLFLSARYIEPNVPIDAGNVTEDSLYKGMMEKLKRFEEKVDKVFILQAFPRPSNQLQKLEDLRIKAGKPIEGFFEEAIEADAVPMRRRVEEIAKNCEKCVVYDLMQLHMRNRKFMVSNPNTHLHYFEMARHHTPIGLKLVEPLYRKLAQNFDTLMKSKSPNNLLTWND